jgi:hypothetical protein
MIGMKGDPAEFEAWLLGEVRAQAWLVGKHKAEGRKDFSSCLTSGYAHALIVTLSRYCDRDPNEIWKVAHDGKLLREFLLNGPSHLGTLEAQVTKAMTVQDSGSYRCRGCSGGCCTGGSDPCTCSPPGSDDD